VCVCLWSVNCSDDLWEYKWSINRVTNPNPVYSHSYTWQYNFLHADKISGLSAKSVGWKLPKLQGLSSHHQDLLTRLVAHDYISFSCRESFGSYVAHTSSFSPPRTYRRPLVISQPLSTLLRPQRNRLRNIKSTEIWMADCSGTCVYCNQWSFRKATSQVKSSYCPR
jgi:hypothetical protein